MTLQKLTFHWDQFLFLSLVKVVLLSMAILGSECIKNWLDEGEKSTAKWSRPDRLESCAGMKATPNFLGMNWMTLTIGRGADNQNGNLRWSLPLGVEHPPPLMAQISRHFFTPLFSFAIESYIYETDFTLGLSQKYHF